MILCTILLIKALIVWLCNSVALYCIRIGQYMYYHAVVFADIRINLLRTRGLHEPQCMVSAVVVSKILTEIINLL